MDSILRNSSLLDRSIIFLRSQRCHSDRISSAPATTSQATDQTCGPDNRQQRRIATVSQLTVAGGADMRVKDLHGEGEDLMVMDHLRPDVI